MNDYKPWWQSTTMWFNIVMFFTELTTLMADSELFKDLVPYLIFGQSIGNMLIRKFLTKKPIGKPKPLAAIVAVISILLFSPVAYSQIKSEVQYQQYEPIILGCDCALKEGETPSFIWNIPAPAQKVVVGDGSNVHVWAPPGRYIATVVVAKVNWKEQSITHEEFTQVFVVTGKGPNPPPEPGPTPDVPPDEFDNVGQKVAKWAAELKLDKTAEIAANYEEAAKRLEGSKTPPIPTIDLAIKFIVSKNNEINKNNTAWATWSTRVQGPWSKHVVDRATAAKFLAAVAAGLKGAK